MTLPCPHHRTVNGTMGGQQHPPLTLRLTAKEKLLVSPHLSATERSARRKVKTVWNQAVVFPKWSQHSPILMDTAGCACAAPVLSPIDR